MPNVPAPPAHTGVLRQVLTLLSGTILAQVIAFVAQIGIARLYTDTDLGYLGIFTSAATLGAAIAGARFDLSIVLPAPGDEASARSLVRLSSRCVLATSALATLTAACAAPPPLTERTRSNSTRRLPIWHKPTPRGSSSVWITAGLISTWCSTPARISSSIPQRRAATPPAR